MLQERKDINIDSDECFTYYFEIHIVGIQLHENKSAM